MRTKKKSPAYLRPILMISISLIITLLNLFIGGKLWVALNLPSELIEILPWVTSILMFVLGVTITLILFINDKSESDFERIRRFIEMVNKQGNFYGYSGIEGLARLQERLAGVRKIWNTRFIDRSEEYNRMRKSKYNYQLEKWRRALKELVIKRDISLSEIVVSSFNKDSEELFLELSDCSTRKGIYSVFILGFNSNLYQNFTILEFNDGKKEIWWGWGGHATLGTEFNCYSSTDEKLIADFENRFRSLKEQAKEFIMEKSDEISKEKKTAPKTKFIQKIKEQFHSLFF